LKSSYTDGFCVVHNGAIVSEYYDQGMDGRTLHLLQSVSKSVTATTLGILAARGAIRTEAPVTHYLPELETTAYRGATIQQLLDMTSGVYWDETYTAPASHCAKMDVACGWKIAPDPGWPTNMWELILTLHEPRGTHGADFNYRSIETDVLGFAMERATGTRLAELVSRELWAPWEQRRTPALPSIPPDSPARAVDSMPRCVIWRGSGSCTSQKEWPADAK
jgi:CubicO group peptidase (beta-lactamase class C family)